MQIDYTPSPKRIEKISHHIANFIAKPARVFHEKLSQKVHIDIHIVDPNVRFPFYTLVTSGMSDLPMNAPKGAEDWKYAELCLALPPQWPLSDEALNDEQNYWPLRTLKFLARYPHITNSWIALGHTLNLTDGNPPKSFHESTELNSVAIFPPILLPEAFHELKLDPKTTIRFYAVVPIFQKERDFAIRNRSQELFARIKEGGVSELLNPKRTNVIELS